MSSSYSSFLLWANPVQTGSVFVTLNLLAFVVLFCSPILTLAYIGLTLMVVGFVFSTAYPKLAAQVPDELVTADMTSGVAEGLQTVINTVFLEGKSLFFWSDGTLALRAGLALYVLKFLSPILSLTALLIIALEGLFLLPLVWEKANLSKTVTPQLEMAKEKMKVAWDAIPRASHVKKGD